MEPVQFQSTYETRNNVFESLPHNPSSFVRRLSFDGSFSPVYGLNSNIEEFEIDNIMGRNRLANDNQSQSYCFRKLQFEAGDENEDIFFSTQDSMNSRNNQVGGSIEFMSFGEQTETMDFQIHRGPQETPYTIRSRRDLSSIKRSVTCDCDDLLMNVSRTNSQDIFNMEPKISSQDNAMCIESEEKNDRTPRKFLPTVKNIRNAGQSAITPQTLVDLVNNTQNQAYLIIDCRYDYEYHGGHIKGALHIDAPSTLETLFVTYRHLLFNRESLEHVKNNFSYLQSHSHFFNSIQTNPTEYTEPIIVFHCEFSQKRGPRALKLLRELDRQLNYNDFPNLFYPEVYILEGGYSNFHKQFPEYCTPENYVKMVDEKYRSMFKQAREKEKRTWEAKSTMGTMGKMFGLQRAKTTAFL